MSVSITRENEGKPAGGTPAVGVLVAHLASGDRLEREHALQSLVALGGAAVAPLIGALADREDEVRWEAARALAEIGDAAAGPALAAALEDPSCDVRWVAGVGLIALGRGGLAPLLRALIERAPSRRLRQGAHHVLYGLCSRGWAEQIAPVLSALEDVEPAATVPPAARTVLETLRGA